jgi:hypothetical protein
MADDTATPRVASDFDRLKELIGLPAHAFAVTVAEARLTGRHLPLYTQVWNADLSHEDLENLVWLAGDRQNGVIKESREAYKHALQMLRDFLLSCIPVRNVLDQQDFRGMIIGRVMGRWIHEREFERLTGRTRGDEEGLEDGEIAEW